jgi:manganese-dependent ADP-ribose/CDP-alcohol diphosphatase
VVVLGHLPILLQASGPYYLLWDHAQVLELLEASPSVIAYLAGHDHSGGYAEQAGIQHLTLPGMLEAPEGTNAYAVVEVWPDRLEVRGVGEVTDRVLARRPSSAE